MLERKLKENILRSLENFPVVAILGSRQVGKTTLAKEIRNIHKKDSIYLDLELPTDINKLQDPELFLSSYNNSLVIIDEIQRIPELFPVIRALVDQNRVPARFLILGSASPALLKQASESLAGRIIYHQLSPFTVEETKNCNETWIKGGYPDSYLTDMEQSFIWRGAFITSYLERDIPQLGIKVPSTQLRRFWTMLAHNHGQLWNASQIAGSLGITAPTVKHYLDILTDTFIVRQLQPFYANLKKRLIKSPKVYIRDSGLLHALLNMPTIEELQGNPKIGSSWEGFVIEQIINSLPEHCETYFYRTSAGAEIDLIIKNKNELVPVEIKYSLTPKLSKGFRIAINDLNCKKGFIIYPGDESYPINENVSTLPLVEIDALLNR